LSKLEGRTIVITGAGSGIGFACAEGFIADGATVYGADINTAGLEALEAIGAIGLETDVARNADVRAMISRAEHDTGRIDVLFNNAGIAHGTRIEDLPDGEFEQMLAIHLFGPVYAMRAALPIMRRNGYGRVINTISRGAEADRDAGYAASKAALWAAGRVAARETRDTDILVNSLIPGPTNTGIWGRDVAHLQPAAAVYSAVRMMATLPASGPSGQALFWERAYPLFMNTLPQGVSGTSWWDERSRALFSKRPEA
jgi:NAD(P)-dependent dehydrogenase (short-subunit alcohol dehydrogenase family)